MTLKIFSVQDLKAEAFMPPFFFTTNGQALRAFKDLVNDGRSTVSSHPEDFRLHLLGTFDDSTGLVMPAPVPEPLGYGTDFKNLPGLPVGVSDQVVHSLPGRANGQNW